MKDINGNTYEGFRVWCDKKYYPRICIDAKSIKLHVYIWEKANGQKPKNHELHHKDFNKKNYSLNNLELLTLSDHRKVHAGWVRGNGKWILKPCHDCKKLLPLSEFYKRKGLTPSSYCIPCNGIRDKKKLIENPEYREKKRLYVKKYYYENRAEMLRKQREKYANRRALVLGGCPIKVKEEK